MVSRLLKLLNKCNKFSYFFFTPNPYAVGTAAEQIYTLAAVQNKFKKKIIIFKINILKSLLKYQICNHSLFEDLIINGYKHKKNFLFKILNFLLELEFFFKRSFVLINDRFGIIKTKEENRFLNVGHDYNYNLNDLIKRDFKPLEEFDSTFINISFEESFLKRCSEILKTFRLNLNKEIVVLHVRDGNYRNDHNRRNFRNSNINNYIKAIKYLIRKNYIVIRLGSNSADKINFKNSNFFDYAHSNVKSDQMDLYMIYICKFFIGTHSGMVEVARLFKKPILITNMYDISGYPPKNEDRGFFKKIFYKDNRISIQNYTKLIIKKPNPTRVLEYSDEVKYVENSEIEIYNFVKKFLLSIEMKNYALSSNEKRINKVIRYKLKKVFLNKKSTGLYLRPDIYPDPIRVALRIKNFKGAIYNIT